VTHWLRKKPRYCLVTLLNSRAGTLGMISN
jgi:hypothetical protein